MQLTCPNCQAVIAAENMSINKETTVCPVCSAEFASQSHQDKQKRHNFRLPDQFEVWETDDNLHVAFKDRYSKFDLISLIISAVTFTFFGFGFLVVEIQSGLTAMSQCLLCLMPLSVFLSWYLVAVKLYNRTHINMNKESIELSRKPIPEISNQAGIFDMKEVITIHVGERAWGKMLGGPSPRNRIWVEKKDGSEKTILAGLEEPYVSFIAQHLKDHLRHLHGQVDSSVDDTSDDTKSEGELLDS